MQQASSWTLSVSIIVSVGRSRRYPGTIRACSPADTLAKIRAFAPSYGVTRLADVTGLDVIGLPVWLAVRPMGRSLSVSQGKGATKELAAVSALMESLEVAHAEEHELDSAVMTIKQYCACSDAVALAGLPLRIDCSLEPEDLIEVVQARSLNSDVPVLLPRASFDLDFTIDFPGTALLARSSNGLASGNTYTEALVHALCEVIERDSVSSWYVSHSLLESTFHSRVDLRTIDDSWCQKQIERIKTAGLEVLVWNAAGRIGLPAFVASIIDRTGRTPYQQRASGYGCHPDAGIALSRALNEAAQSRLTAISGSRDDVTWDHYNEALPAGSDVSRRWWRSVTSESPTLDFRRIANEQSLVSNNLETNLAYILECMERAGHGKAFVIDLDRPGPMRDAGLRVLHVTIPGMQTNARKFHTLADPGLLGPETKAVVDGVQLPGGA